MTRWPKWWRRFGAPLNNSVASAWCVLCPCGCRITSGIRPIRLTRFRPYRKGDNAHVEQKNWMWPRQLLGYGRLGDPELVGPIDRLYKESRARALTHGPGARGRNPFWPARPERQKPLAGFSAESNDKI